MYSPGVVLVTQAFHRLMRPSITFGPVFPKLCIHFVISSISLDILFLSSSSTAVANALHCVEHLGAFITSSTFMKAALLSCADSGLSIWSFSRHSTALAGILPCTYSRTLSRWSPMMAPALSRSGRISSIHSDSVWSNFVWYFCSTVFFRDPAYAIFHKIDR